MFNDNYRDHQIEHRGADDQLWQEVRRVVQQQNDRMSGGFAFEQGEQAIESPTSGLSGPGVLCGVRSYTF